MTLKIKVGSLVLTEARNESLPQEFAAWHQTVRIVPGTYDVFAYLDTDRVVKQLSAQCEGLTISSNFRSHMLGMWGRDDNNRKCDLCTLCDAIVRIEWNPCTIDPQSTSGKMWRFTWNPASKPIIIEQPRHGGGLYLEAFEGTRRFRVDAAETTDDPLRELDISLSAPLHSIDQLTLNETREGWSWSLKKSCKVTRLA